ncbi:PREDICTED: uncharacterized protein LOC106111982 [Papilio polytes]|uniref:uncharacterized protein LOC106111982 n=1 Tax=Papilio polytes TaxID=76194 RepID=UPI00067605E2|nr:PREDICTED: uncharacterized protein LOC106111982 [Papilio polytes]XP_013149660.1 PREDICTED: uncharacterized protein LOC106111982 [Papilio polytes]
MAYFTLIATIVLVVGVNADSSDNDNPFPGFPFNQFQRPFHNVHVNSFQPFFPFPLHPVIPPFPTIKIPSPDDIIGKNPNPGETYSGIVVQSSSGYTTDENGNVVKTGGTTVVTNDNGEVKEYKVGKNPPVIKNNIVPPVPVVPPMPLFFPEIHISSFNNDNLKNIKPGPNQHFVGSSSSSFTVSSNVNGKKNYAGASKTIVNNNGKVDEQALVIENSV